MEFVKSVPGALTLVLVLGALLAFTVVGIQVHRITHPERQPDMALNLGASLAKAEDVTFQASDRTSLSGWLFKGSPGHPAIVLAHDLGESKNALISLAVVLNQSGFTVLAFDFRGHGSSGGSGSTLGIDESRDVIGAVDFLASLPAAEVDTRRIGVYGTGMGAHAAVLAAAERASMRVLVLDGLWPDAKWTLVHRTFEEWPWATDHLGALPSVAFAMLSGGSATRDRAEDILPALGTRDVLLVASASNARLGEILKAMYDTLPESRDAERSLVTLPAPPAGIPASDLAAYHHRIVEFFSVRLSRT
jgi:alpha-beta hydrolase superfamily lysophospholipase